MSKVQETIDTMYVILNDECSRLSKLQAMALKKGQWQEVYEYGTKFEEVQHLINRFLNEIDNT